ncbi:MAG: glycogen-binding domain-containing protein [Candidatus Bipolaricaulota bacterium]
MRYEGLDELIRDSLQEERAEARDLLDGLERTVTVGLASQSSAGPRWRRWWEALWSPPVSKGAAVAVVTVLALVVGFLAGRMWLPGGVQFEEGVGGVFAVVAPRADSVAVMGDFSGWQPVPLEYSEGTGVWTAELDLPPGRYEYAFMVDGRWVGQDPVADEYVRSFGEYTSVRYVESDS